MTLTCNNKLIDVPGIAVGHKSLGDTGCTVIAVPDSAIAAVDVRGGGPGTRETDLLAPHNTVQRVHAITLTGGSAYGLAAADGVMARLEEDRIGFRVLDTDESPIVPIVPAAVIFDLLVGDPTHRPTRDDGYAAAHAALTGEPDTRSGSVGAGCGATAGRLRGGFGQASMQVREWIMAAGIVANPMGDVMNPDTGEFWADPRRKVAVDKLPAATPKLNTTIGVIATNAPITKAQAKRLAMVAHDGIARAIHPAHSPLDGDTLFCLSTGDGTGVDLETMLSLSTHAAEITAAAIVDAVVAAEPGFGLNTYFELTR